MSGRIECSLSCAYMEGEGGRKRRTAMNRAEDVCMIIYRDYRDLFLTAAKKMVIIDARNERRQNAMTEKPMSSEELPLQFGRLPRVRSVRIDDRELPNTGMI